MNEHWTLYHHGRRNALYVYLCPPHLPERPQAFALAGLPDELRRRLWRLGAGEAVPQEIVDALLTLALAPGDDSLARRALGR